MILDRIENAAMYRALDGTIRAALDSLRSVDFTRLPEGKHTLDGDRLFAMVQRYKPKPLAEIKWEAHRRYIDVQYVAAGAERIGWAALHEGVKVVEPYDAEKDVAMFDAKGDLLSVPAGYFTIFTPHDIHAPCLCPADTANPAEVWKIVVKCLVEA
jgi:biofilm protein TabA